MSYALLETTIANGVRVESVTLQIKKTTTDADFDDFLKALHHIHYKPGRFVVVYNLLYTRIPCVAHINRTVVFLRSLEKDIQTHPHHVVVVTSGVAKCVLKVTVKAALAVSPATCPIVVVNLEQYAAHQQKAYPWCTA